MLIYDESTEEVFEVPEEDCELEGNGFWLLAAEGEDEEEFYEFCEIDVEDAE